jgi:Family of unknown function (DUF5317)
MKRIIKEAYLWILMLPFISFALGFIMNESVIAANRRIMPVLEPICTEEMFDGIHRCMQHTDHLKWLADWITFVGLGMFSPGDLFIIAYQYLAPYCAVIWATLLIAKVSRRSEWPR